MSVVTIRSDWYPNLRSQVNRWPQRSGQLFKGWGLVFGSILRQKWPQSNNSSTIVIRSSCRVEWYTFCLVKVKIKVDPEVKVRSHHLRYQSIWELGASTMVPFSTLYLNSIGSHWRKTLLTQKDPCDVICDVSQKRKKVGRYVSSVLQQHLIIGVRIISFMLQNGHFGIPT